MIMPPPYTPGEPVQFLQVVERDPDFTGKANKSGVCAAIGRRRNLGRYGGGQVSCRK